MAQTLFILIVCFITGGYLIERILEFLNDKHWSATLPNELKDIYDTDKYKRSQQYDKVKRKISAWSSSFNMTLIILMLFFDGFAILDQWASSIADRAVWQGLPAHCFGASPNGPCLELGQRFQSREEGPLCHWRRFIPAPSWASTRRR